MVRIHRYTVDRLRSEIGPVSGADFTRLLFAWQHVSADSRAGTQTGTGGGVQIEGGCNLYSLDRARLPFPQP